MSDASGCPPRETLERIAQGRAGLPESLREHIIGCKACGGVLAELKSATLSLQGAMAVKGSTQPVWVEPAPPVARTESSLSAAPALDETPAPTSPTLSLGSHNFLSPAEKPDEIGRLGPYRVLKVLGEGGMGIVFKAEDPALERHVALKVMKPESAADEISRKRFLMEGKLAAQVQHDHVVAIYQVDESRGVPFLAMQFLEGEPLDRRLKREGKLPIGEVLRIGREVAEGLAAAHEKGLVHRDIKPANIWLETRPTVSGFAAANSGKGESRAKILDFGLARGVGDKATHLTRTGVIMGTPDYMAPEQARGQDLDARCDLFSLGCVMYHMATGRKPFHGDDVMATLLALATDEPMPMRQINPDVPWELEERVKALMAKIPGDRPRDARMVVEELAYLEKNLATLGSTPRPKAAAAPSGPAAPGGVPRPGARRQRRTVNPNASVDELLRTPSPTAEKRPAGTPPARTDSVGPPKPTTPADRPSAGDTAPLEAMGLSGWSGPAEALPETEKPKTVRRPVTDTVRLSKAEMPKPAALPLGPAKKPEELKGTCPRCGSTRFGKMGLGWCQACGYSADMPVSAADGVAAVQARYRQERSLTWIWTVLLGAIVIVAASLFVNEFVLRRGTQSWTMWVWFQFSAGGTSFLFAIAWAYYVVWQYHDDSDTFLPMFCTPIRFLRTVIRRRHQTKHAICLGGWGLAATLAIFYVVGDPKFWWKDDRFKGRMPEPTMAMQANQDDPEDLKESAECQVIGYFQEGDRITGVVLAENGKYAGSTRKVAEAAATEEAFKYAVGILARNARTNPPIKGIPGAVSARWVEPKLGATVECGGRTPDGKLIKPRVVAWK